jgi:DNA-binding phage protein
MDMRTNRDYKADLLADLQTDPAYQVLYLAAAQKDSGEALLVAFRDVAEARIGTPNSGNQQV